MRMIHDPIAERTLSSVATAHDVHVRVARPEPDPDGAWRCAYSIADFPAAGQTQEGEAFGSDSMQALLLALVAVGAALEPSGTNLRFLGMENLGLPLLDENDPSLARFRLR